MPDKVQDQNLEKERPKGIQQFIGGTLAELAEAGFA